MMMYYIAVQAAPFSDSHHYIIIKSAVNANLRFTSKC